MPVTRAGRSAWIVGDRPVDAATLLPASYDFQVCAHGDCCGTSGVKESLQGSSPPDRHLEPSRQRTTVSHKTADPRVPARDAAASMPARDQGHDPHNAHNLKLATAPTCRVTHNARPTLPQVGGVLRSVESECGQGRGRTTDLPLFSSHRVLTYRDVQELTFGRSVRDLTNTTLRIASDLPKGRATPSGSGRLGVQVGLGGR
jgi:hypothetical protein